MPLFLALLLITYICAALCDVNDRPNILRWQRVVTEMIMWCPRIIGSLYANYSVGGLKQEAVKMWEHKLIKEHINPYRLVQDPTKFMGKCIDQNEIGHHLFDAVHKKNIFNNAGVNLGQAEDIHLLAKNLTPYYLESVSHKWGFWPGQRFFFPFSSVTDVCEDEVHINLANFSPTDAHQFEATSALNRAEGLISLKQKLYFEDNCFGWRWRKEYEDQQLEDDPFRDGMFW